MPTHDEVNQYFRVWCLVCNQEDLINPSTRTRYMYCICPWINQSERKVYNKCTTFWRQDLEGLKRYNASSLWCHAYTWHKFTYRLAIPSHVLSPKKSDTSPKMRNWTCDNALQSLGHYSSTKISNNWGFLTDESQILVVMLFLVKKVTFGSLGSILPYRTHKLHFFELMTLFFRTNDLWAYECMYVCIYNHVRTYTCE
jgi:hypothetical protein